MTDINKEQKTVSNIYAMFSATLVLGIVPQMSFAFLAMIMFTIATLAAYTARRRAEPDSLTANHMTYLIRTLWITSLFGLVTMAVAIAYMLANYDASPLMDCVNNVASSIGSGTQDVSTLQNHVAPCMDDFTAQNKTVLITATFIGGGPLVIYFGYRLAKGLSRAVKGHRIGDVQNWF